MRIISGKFKGFSLHMAVNINTRPLKDRVRESVFNLLIHSNKILINIEKSNILDLYSGTGSFGLECLSRYAEKVFFIENDKHAQEILKKNIKKMKIENKTKIYFEDVFVAIKKNKNLYPKFDLVFCDPPFKQKNIKELIKLLFHNNLVKKHGILILHRNKNEKEDFPDYFNVLEERIYGMSKIIFGKFLS